MVINGKSLAGGEVGIKGNVSSQYLTALLMVAPLLGKGKLRGVDVDLNHIPDAAMTIATAALFAEGPTCIRNVYN